MYPTLDSVNTTGDLSTLLVYANVLTNGVLMPAILGAFFLIVLLGSFIMQIRFRGDARPEVSFAVASFTTFGFAVLMSIKNGLLNPIYLYVTISVSILAVLWLVFSED